VEVLYIKGADESWTDKEFALNDGEERKDEGAERDASRIFGSLRG